MSTTIRVSDSTHDRFARLAALTGRPMTQLLDEAVDTLERRVFLEQLADRFAELRDDPAAWSVIEAERATESSALRDRAT